MSFRRYAEDVRKWLDSATFHEIDQFYREGITAAEAVRAIRCVRRAAKASRIDARRGQVRDFEVSDFDYGMNA